MRLESRYLTISWSSLPETRRYPHGSSDGPQGIHCPSISRGFDLLCTCTRRTHRRFSFLPPREQHPRSYFSSPPFSSFINLCRPVFEPVWHPSFPDPYPLPSASRRSSGELVLTRLSPSPSTGLRPFLRILALSLAPSRPLDAPLATVPHRTLAQSFGRLGDHPF